MLRIMRSGDNIKGLEDLTKKLPQGITMIEVGTYAGESTEIFLKSGKIDKVYCIDLWHIEDWAEAEKPVDELVKKYPQIVKMKMSSENASREFENESVDFIYIDANHWYEPCKADIKNYLPKIKKGGIISGHDYKMPSVKQAVNEMLGQPDEVFIDSSWFIKL